MPLPSYVLRPHQGIEDTVLVGDIIFGEGCEEVFAVVGVASKNLGLGLNQNFLLRLLVAWSFFVISLTNGLMRIVHIFRVVLL